MCGIIGCIAKGRAAAIGLEGLKRLEYRGYDSAGAALIKDGRLLVLKDSGRIAEIDGRLGISGMGCDMAILHTRWATHGEPSGVNAHPHTDCRGRIAIVHNGIIENHASLRTMLEAEGHKFRSETDSEVIAHLIEKFYSGGLKDAVSRAVRLLEGAYAIAAISEAGGSIVAARKGSPLVLGVGDGISMLASDAGALAGFVGRVVYLDDNEVCELRQGSYDISNERDESVRRDATCLTLTPSQMEKGSFKHFMQKEIFEQPESIRNTLRGRLSAAGVKISVSGTAEAKRVVIVSCGTAWHAGLVGKRLIESLAGVPAEVDYASEFRYRNPLVGPDDLVVAISQSGETADTLAAVREAKKRGARVIGIVNVVGSSIAREVGSGIYLHAGPEIGVASTKAFTSQLVALCLLALHMRRERGWAADPGLIEDLKRLPEAVSEALKADSEIRSVAKEFAGAKDFLYLARGANYPIALEGSLKLKELSYIHAEGYPAGEMKHGPIALIDKSMPVVFIATGNGGNEKLMSNMEEVRARGGRVIAIANEPASDSLKRLAERIIYVPKTRDELSPVVNVIPLQLLAYHIADMRGCDIDKPRNLAKAVSVE
jgi:glucosamine--fructose-6-phosphate aminotransferase (isomerizing)